MKRRNVTVCKSSERGVDPGALGFSLGDINDAFDFVGFLFAHFAISALTPPLAVKLCAFLCRI